MGLRNFLDEALANVNPFDGGANASTVSANRKKIQPARTPAPGSRPPSNFISDTVRNVGNFSKGFTQAGAINPGAGNFTKDQLSKDTATRLGQTLNGSLQSTFNLANNNIAAKTVVGVPQGIVTGATSLVKQFEGKEGNNYTDVKNPLLQKALDTKKIGDFQGEGQNFVNDAPQWLKPAIDNDVAKNLLGATGAVLNLSPVSGKQVQATGKLADKGVDALKIGANRTGQIARDVVEAPRENVLGKIAQAGGQPVNPHQNLFNNDTINAIPTQGGVVDRYANELFGGKDIGRVNVTKDANGAMVPLTRDDANKLAAYRGVYNDTYGGFDGQPHPLSNIPVNQVEPNFVTKALDLKKAQSEGGFVGNDGSENFDDLINGTKSSHNQFIDEAVASHKNQDEYRNSVIDSLWNDNKKGSGVDFIHNDLGQGDFDTKRISNNSDFYRAYYQKYNKPPTKKAITDMVDQLLAGKEGEYDSDILGLTMDPNELEAHQSVYAQLADRTNALDRVATQPEPKSKLAAFARKSQAKKLEPQPEAVPVKIQAPEAPTSPLDKETSSLPGSVDLPNTPGKTNVKLNTKRLNMDDASKSVVDAETARQVKTMSNDEVQEIAKTSGIDYKSYGDEGTRKAIAEQLNLRKQLVEVSDARKAALKSGDAAEAERLTTLMGEMGRASSSQGRNVARQLQARRIVADAMKTPEQRLFKLLDLAGVEPDVAAKRLGSVDFDNADDVITAYRDLVPAKASDWLDKYRYTNMLSSPLTHIVNVASNAQGVFGVAPIQKAVEGGLDAARSAITGGDRTRYAGEAGQYLKGAAKSVPEALQNFKDVLSGKKISGPIDDISITNGRLATKGILGKLDTTLSFVPKLLEASDQLGMTIAKSGEEASLAYRASKGAKVPTDLKGFAEDAAEYRNFRQELGKEGQGPLLEAVDAIPKAIMKLRTHKNPIIAQTAKFTIPFVTTPANLFKQGIEYSPAGILTIPGNADKTAQAAKVAMGTSAMGIAAATFAGNDAITFSEPSDAKQRDAFRAEGKQAYSIKIGDKWYAYSKLHPALAFNFASVAAVKDALDKGSIDQSAADKALNGLSGVLGFFRDQSYMKSVGDFTSNLQVKDGATLQSNFAQMASNYANQLVPFKSLTSYIGRYLDPTQRKTDTDAQVPEQIYQNLVKDIPGLNGAVPGRKDPYTGENIKNDNPLLNSLSPVKVTNDKGYGNTTGLTPDQRMIQQQLGETKDKEQFRQSVIDTKFSDKQALDQQAAIKKADEQGIPVPDSLKGLSSGNVIGGKQTADKSSGDIKKLANGKYYAKVDGAYKTFDSEAKAKKAIDTKTNEKAIADFTDSSAKLKQIGDKVYYKTGDGSVKSKTKFDYDADNEDADISLAIDRAKSNENYDDWQKAADKKFNLLDKRLARLDPTTEKADIDRLTKQKEDLIDEAQKYAGYGGLKKGKSGTASSGSKSKYDLTAYLNTTSTGSSLRDLVKAAKVTGRKA